MSKFFRRKKFCRFTAEKVVEIDLNKAEQAMFDKSVAAVRGLIDVVRKLQRGEKQ